MKSTIWKYPLKPGRTEVAMPQGADVLTAMNQHGPVIWAIVDPNAGPEVRKFVVYGTGDDIIGDSMSTVHVGSCIDSMGMVWHVFEEDIC